MKFLRLKLISILFLGLFSSVALADSRTGQNSTNVTIPDATAGGPGAWVASTITISGAPAGAVVSGINVTFGCVHTYSSDLVVDLNADVNGSLGNIHLWNREGGSADNPTRTVTGITTYNGLSVNRTWYLYARDYVPADTGFIDYWSIEVFYTAPPPTPTVSSVNPSQPIATGSAQPFTITGSDFTSTATVDLEDVTTSEQFYNRPISSRSGTTGVTINPNFGTAIPGGESWRVRVNNGTLHSTWFNFLVLPPTQTPTISSVSPAQPVATGSAQPFTITGSNFPPTATVDLEDVTTGEQFYNRTISSRSGTTGITINPNFGTAIPGGESWRVRVNNGTVHSTWFNFLVMPQPTPSTDGFDYPFGPPNGSPRCPGTNQCAGGWQNVQDFRVNNHLGEDWNFGFADDDLGMPVFATANGIVTYAQDTGIDSWRGVVIILHSGNNLQVPGGSPVTQVKSMYAHLDVAHINDWVSAGSTVTRGQQIGVIGPTPAGSTGPHLHLELRTDTSILLGPGYSSNAVGWTDPSNFIDANRPAGADTIRPTIAEFSVEPGRVIVGHSLSASCTMSDTGGSGLNRVELWRASIDGTQSDSSWSQRGSITLSGNGPVTRTLSDTPSVRGSYWYGVHVFDNAGNNIDERMSGLGPVRVFVDCSSADFNNDGDVATDLDIEDFFRCIAGTCCPTCDTADFNGDGDTATDADIEAFFRVLAGGPC